MSYTDLTMKTGLDSTHISKIANENGGVNLETAMKIARALDLSIEEIFVPEKPGEAIEK